MTRYATSSHSCIRSDLLMIWVGPLPKKGDRTVCANRRRMALLSVAGKVSASVILNTAKEAVSLSTDSCAKNRLGFKKITRVLNKVV